MSRLTDKFTYTTSYKQEFCIGHALPREPKRVEEVTDEDCKQRFIPGIHVGGTYTNTSQQTCPCQPGGLMPQRGAKVRDLPTNMDVVCCSGCHPSNKRSQPRPVETKVVKDLPAEEKRKAVEERMPCREPENLVVPQKFDQFERRKPRKTSSPKTEPQYDPRERRDTDANMRRNPQTQPMPVQIEREPLRSNERIPGPYWIRQNGNNGRGNDDRRRAYEFTCRRRVGDDQNPASGYGYGDPNVSDPNDDMYGNENVVRDEGNGGNGNITRKPCVCQPPPPKSGPDRWLHERDWGPAQGRGQGIPTRMEEPAESAPEARVSCVPETEVSKFDQPNTFMRKLYEKYPFLYQVLQETPPEELVSRVFKDRFLSTYQVDFLHMGIGKQAFVEGGAKMEESYKGAEGEPEPTLIPGCSYRYSQKSNFGRKKFEYSKREIEQEEETNVQETKKDEPDVSEYMGTISKLGGEIITDQLYKVSMIAKRLRNAKT